LIGDSMPLLGHANYGMAGHYASADVGRLIKLANLVLKREGTCTVLRVSECAALRPVDKRSSKDPAGLETISLAARNPLNIGAPGRT
jgi:hypothetical protein